MIWRAAYAAALWLALPWIVLRLWWRARREPGYRERVAERFGRYGPKAGAPAGCRPLVWIHAVSLGETRAAEPLLARIAEKLPGCEFLVTHMTASGREAAERLFGATATLAWLPYDYPFAIRRFLAHFRPSVGILMETEVWFNLVRGCREAGVPLLLANARLSEKSARGYAAVEPLSRAAFSALARVAAQTDSDAQRIRRLGAREVRVTGNLKFDMRASRETAGLARELRRSFGARPVFLAASTRDGEEELILEALEQERLEGALTVIVPRHPQRFEEVAALLRGAGHGFVRRSERRAVPEGCRFVLGDSMGELPAYYGAADVAFVGGSLLAFGGQNLIEACAAGVPVLFGPYTYNFADAAQAALKEGAALRIADAAALAREVRLLLADPPRRERMGRAGLAFCASHRGASDRVVAMIEELLPRTR